MTDLRDRLTAALVDRYVIERELGSGGMATVYLAEDVKHHRQVAVKVLRPELAAVLGAERFLREIEIAANLTHPHILPLYDSGEADGFLYYVMPYIEGESLRDRLARERELPISEALRLLRDVADALDYAHQRGIVHRDIKPDNVMLSGRHAMVTDFGVAKAVSEATGRHQLTTAGVALGTPAYMAPEQAMADPHTDHRADVYAFGAMAYEVLTGRQVFEGASSQEVLAKAVTEAPQPVTAHRAAVPEGLQQVVMKCLEKKPADRWQSGGELLQHLEVLQTPTGGTTPVAAEPLARPSKLTRSTVIGLAATLVVAIGGMTVLLTSSRGPTPITAGRTTQLTLAPELELDPAISPDGNFVAYASGQPSQMKIYVRQTGASGTVALTEGITGHHRAPQWSPDQTEIAYHSGGAIYAVPALGGIPRLLVDPPPGRAALSPTWSPDGREIAYALAPAQRGPRGYVVRSSGGEIYIQSLAGGEARKVAEGFDLHSVRWSGDGSWIAYVSGASQYTFGVQELGNVDPSAIWVVSPRGGDPVPVTDSVSLNISPTWLPGGNDLLYISNRAGRRDLYQLKLRGSGQPAGDAVRITTVDAQTVSVSGDGAVSVYSAFDHRANVWALDIPTGGPVSISGAQPVTSGAQVVESIEVSPDGAQLAFDANREGNHEIYVMPLTGGAPRRLTDHPADDYHPTWSPDGSEIAFHSLRNGNRDIFVMSADGRSVRPLTSDPAQEWGPNWSPDGLSVAFSSDKSGPRQIFVLSRDSLTAEWGEPRHLSATSPSTVPVWSPDSREIVYTDKGAVYAVAVDGGTTRLIVGHEEPGPAAQAVQWSDDGSTIYILAFAEGGVPSLWSVPAAGGQPRILVEFDDPSKQSPLLWFTHDGQRFYFTFSEFESDLWLMDLGPSDE